MQRPYPRLRNGVYVKAAQEQKPVRAAGEQPVAVKLDKDVVEMREVMVRIGSVRCTLVIYMTINNHYVEAVVDSGAQVSILSRISYDSLSCRPQGRPQGIGGPRRSEFGGPK